MKELKFVEIRTTSDKDYKPIGQGNGIPDIIDEAAWGTLIFEILQDKNGGVRSGTERNGYPVMNTADSLGLDRDTDQYGAFRISKPSTTLAAGLFAHLARELKPFNKERSAELQKRAEHAWAYVGDTTSIPHKLYYYIQYYLLTGNEDIHRQLIKLAPEAARYETTHQDNPRSVPNGRLILGIHFCQSQGNGQNPQPGTWQTTEFIDGTWVTFSSGINNINFEIADGNEAAIAMRYHIAQVCAPVGSLVPVYTVLSFSHGLHINIPKGPEGSVYFTTKIDQSPLQTMSEFNPGGMPALPQQTTWLNISDLGAKMRGGVFPFENTLYDEITGNAVPQKIFTSLIVK